MITYNNFLEDISKLQSKGWKPKKNKIDNINETIEYLEQQISEGNMNPDTIMESLKIEMNIANTYCHFIKTSVKNLYEKYEKSSTFDFQEIYNVHFCIGDLTSKISSNKEVNMLFIFQPESSTSRIVESLILLSKLPFENDVTRKAFNNLVQNYQKLGKNPQNLHPVPLENPGSCYIATMVYGDYDHPQVIVLRKFRDDILLKKIFGRLFVKIYYFISPLFVKILKRYSKTNKLIKQVLDRFINYLNRQKNINNHN